MFSIPVSELTPDLLSKAEHWRIYDIAPNGYAWADVRNREQLAIGLTDDPTCPLMDTAEHSVYHESSRCFPVSISLDGTEVRLECPRMPDEVEIEGWESVRFTVDHAKQHSLNLWRIENQGEGVSTFAESPTPEHSPRLSLEGVWVWSTRR